jgi:hypothetical protein
MLKEFWKTSLCGDIRSLLSLLVREAVAVFHVLWMNSSYLLRVGHVFLYISVFIYHYSFLAKKTCMGITANCNAVCYRLNCRMLKLMVLQKDV